MTVTVYAADGDGLGTMSLKYSVSGGAWQTAVMTHQGGGKYTGTIPGQAAATLVQFYVEGQDALGAVAQFPAEGQNSRALVRWNDGQASTGLLHNFRILMTQADTDRLHLSTNTTSNERLPATIIYNESEIFYDAGVRLKGSFVGRDVDRVGFNVSFNPDQLFRGVHDKVAIDRSQTATAISPTEMLLFQVANGAGGLPSRYDDLIQVIAPRSAQTSVGHLRMAGFDEVFLDEQFSNGSDGNVYEFEVLRWATTTVDGNPESIKNSAQSGNGYDNVDIQALGTDKEDYRWLFLLSNNRTRDDYSDLIPFAQAFSLSGTALDAAVAQTMDVDEWMRVFALNTLGGVRDAYNWDNHHNMRLYARPEDGKVLALPWDWDNVFNSPTAPLVGGGNLAKIINRPQNLRLLYGHLQNMIATSFNTTYMSYWTNHYGQVAGRDFSWVLNYISQRAANVTSQLASLAPQVPFTITTNGGADFTVNTTAVTLEGNGWINVRTIRLANSTTPLDVTWIDADSWRVTLPIGFGANALTLQAYDFQGALIPSASDTITVTSTVSGRPLQDFLRISEIMYNPNGDDGPEFIELLNTGNVTLNIANARFTNGIDFTFGDVSLPAGERMLVVRSRAAFEAKYGVGLPIAGEYIGSASNSLDNAGERITLVDDSTAIIQSFIYSDDWYPVTDGDDYSLVVIAPAASPDLNMSTSWRPSFELGGSPGKDDLMQGDINGDQRVNLLDLSVIQLNLGIGAGATRATGDLNGDGEIDRLDVAVVAQNYGRSYTPPAAPSAAPAAVTVRVIPSIRRPIVDSAAAASEESPRPMALRATARRLPAAAVDQILSPSPLTGDGAAPAIVATSARLKSRRGQ